MDHYLAWLNTLPPFLKGLAVVASVLAGLGIVGAVTLVMMSGQGSPGGEKLTRKQWLYVTLIFPVYLVGLGLVVCAILALILGPFLLFMYVLRWPYLPALLLGLPAGFLLLGLAWMALEAYAGKRTKNKP